jgi:outer membrane receptor for monomeric catechols
VDVSAPGGYTGADHHQRHAHADAASGRAASGHGRDARTDARPDDDERGGCGPLRAGHHAHQGENNRDDVVIRGNRSSADFFLNGMRDDVQYYRDLYNLDAVEALKGPNALIFGRGNGGGGASTAWSRRPCSCRSGVHAPGRRLRQPRFTGDLDQPLGKPSPSGQRDGRGLRAASATAWISSAARSTRPLTVMATTRTKLTFGYEHLRDERVADRGITSFQGRPADVPSTRSTATRTTATSSGVNSARSTSSTRSARSRCATDADRRLRPLLPELRAGRVSADRARLR